MDNFYNENDRISKKSWLTSLILCWFFGFLGIHRLYAGKIGSGFLMNNCSKLHFGIRFISWCNSFYCYGSICFK